MITCISYIWLSLLNTLYQYSLAGVIINTLCLHDNDSVYCIDNNGFFNHMDSFINITKSG